MLVLATDYPGAPGDPNPLVPYDLLTVHVDGEDIRVSDG
jgi:hypothetical protein